MALQVEAYDHVDTSGGFEEYRLRENGLQVLLCAEGVAPVVTVMVTYRAGSGDEAPGGTGGMHFLEHVMFKGTDRYNKRRGTSVIDMLQSVGAQVNATTSKDRTNYYAVLPVEHMELAIDIEADRMRGLLLNAVDIEAERTVILNEMDRAENDPLGNMYRLLWSTAYRSHPYGHPTLGWRDDVEAMTVEGLRRLYDTHYWPDRATISVIGDVEATQALRLIAERFSNVPPCRHRTEIGRASEPDQVSERRFTTQASAYLAAVMIGFKIPETLHPDSEALAMLAGLLSGGKSSRLYRRCTDQGLTAHVSARMTPARDPSLFECMAILSPGRTHEEVEAAIVEEIGRVCAEGVTVEELQRVRNQLRAAEAFSRDGSFAMAAPLNEAVAAGDWRLFTTFRERLERVTAQDVQRVAQAHLASHVQTTAWLIPEA